MLVASEQAPAITAGNAVQQIAADAAADEFSEKNRSHKEQIAPFRAVYIQQHERDDQGVGKNVRDRCPQAAELAGQAADHGAEQCGGRTDDNVPWQGACQKVGQQTADGKAGNGRGSKAGKDAQHLRDAELDDTARKPEKGRQPCQRDIEGGDHRAFGDAACGGNAGGLHDLFILLSFVLGNPR